MNLPLSAYRTLIFDCDGVILDSNRVKTQAFYNAALPYGEVAAQRLVAYHTQNGGISRYKKFGFFLSTMLPPAASGPCLEELLASYAHEVKQGLLTCAIAEGLHALREKCPDARWLVASGGDQSELREIFIIRGLDGLFDGGIFGSPDSKEHILQREIISGNVRQPALFIGDSRYDHIAAALSSLDFVFVHGWSEFDGWRNYCSANNLMAIRKLEDLCVR